MMESRERKRLNLSVDNGTATICRRAAERLGYTTESGSMAGKGNLSALLRGLAAGRVDAHEFERALEKERERKLVDLEGEKDE